jgi:hypothetical protein
MVSPWMPNGTLEHSEKYNAERDCLRIVGTLAPLCAAMLIEDLQLAEVASGLAYLHAEKVVHADVHGVKWTMLAKLLHSHSM